MNIHEYGLGDETTTATEWSGSASMSDIVHANNESSIQMGEESTYSIFIICTDHKNRVNSDFMLYWCTVVISDSSSVERQHVPLAFWVVPVPVFIGNTGSYGSKLPGLAQ